MQKVVLDTNILLVSISSRSKLHWVFQSLLKKEYILCVTTDILAEYEEILERHMGSEVSHAVMETLTTLPNVARITPYFRFHLLRDEDDDKFVDCAIAASASCIVSHDKDFQPLSQVEFPEVRVIDTRRFREELLQQT